MMAIRLGRFKIVVLPAGSPRARRLAVRVHQAAGTQIFDIVGDPFERGDESIYWDKWFVDHVPYRYAASAVVGQWLQSFKDYPIRQKPASFNLDEVMRKLSPPPQ